jgi:hypothetical protein
MPLDGATSSTFGTLPKLATAAKSFDGQVRIGGGRAGMSSGVDQQRVAVGLRFRHRRRTETAAGPTTVLDHDGLTELARQRIEYDTAQDIDGAAS